MDRPVYNLYLRKYFSLKSDISLFKSATFALKNVASDLNNFQSIRAMLARIKMTNSLTNMANYSAIQLITEYSIHLKCLNFSMYISNFDQILIAYHVLAK